MRILHIYKDYFPVIGGIENHVRILAEAQAALGHSVTVVTTSQTRQGHAETRNDVRVIYCARLADLSSAPFSVEMFRKLAGIESDVSHLQSPYPFGEMAQFLFGRSRAMVLTYQSDIVRQRVSGLLYRPLLHRVLARADRIIATSPNYVESSPLLRHWRDKCVVVPLASPRSSPPLTLKDSAAGNELLFVGRLRYYKGLEYLLNALPAVPEARLTVVGTGPMQREWKALASELGLDGRVRWMGDVGEQELPSFYSACDVFVLPCSERSEAFGMVQLEAMAAGKPVISCDVNTGVAWVNQNEMTGIVVPPKNAEALGRAITRLLGDKTLRERMGRAGQARVALEFTVEKMVDRVMRVYEEALARRGHSPEGSVK
jgi:rhamnosyl/mannosyltransferase